MSRLWFLVCFVAFGFYGVYSSTSQPTSRPTSKVTSLLPTLVTTHSPTTRTPTTIVPSKFPTIQPSFRPSSHPSSQPTSQPSTNPTCPTSKPSSQPSSKPTRQPSSKPTGQPSSRPSQPTSQPTGQPSTRPSRLPTCHPSSRPSYRPSSQPSRQPIASPSAFPSYRPTSLPSVQPSVLPSCRPSMQPSSRPTLQPISFPTTIPSSRPSRQPSDMPTGQPSVSPTGEPSGQPSVQPSSLPTEGPSSQPTSFPSTPSSQPSSNPSSTPSTQPTTQPTDVPTSSPTPKTFCSPGSIYVLEGGSVRGSTVSDYSRCVVCPAGTYSTSNNSSYCEPTPPGSYSLSNSTAAILCPQNYYSVFWYSSSCTRCPQGYVNGLIGSQSEKDCINPVINFVVGSIAIFGSILFIFFLLFKGKLHENAFHLKFRYVRKCVLLFGAVMTTADMSNLTINLLNAVTRDENPSLLQRLWRKFFKPIIFGVLCIVVLFVVSAFIIFRTTIRIIFTTTVLWRAYKHVHIGHVHVDVKSMEDLFKPLEAEITKIFWNSEVYSKFVNPIVYVYNAVANLNINLNVVKITCVGAQSPLYLATNLFILYVVVTVIESDVHIFWTMTLTNALDKIKGLVYNKYYLFSWNIYPTLVYIGVASGISQLPDPRSIVQICLGFVEIRSFFNFDYFLGKAHSWVPYTANCNRAATYQDWNGIKRTLPFDSILSQLSGLFVLLILPIVIYMVSVVLFNLRKKETLKTGILLGTIFEMDKSESGDCSRLVPSCMRNVTVKEVCNAMSARMSSRIFRMNKAKSFLDLLFRVNNGAEIRDIDREVDKPDSGVDIYGFDDNESVSDVSCLDDEDSPSHMRARCETRMADFTQLTSLQRRKGFSTFGMIPKVDVPFKIKEEDQLAYQNANAVIEVEKSDTIADFIGQIFALEKLVLAAVFYFGKVVFYQLKHYLKTPKMILAKKLKPERTIKVEVVTGKGKIEKVKKIRPEEKYVRVEVDAYEHDKELELLRRYVQDVELCNLRMQCFDTVDEEYLFERRLEHEAWLDVEKNLPSYFNMCLEIREEMKEKLDQHLPWGYKWMCYLMPTQLIFSEIGRRHWYRVAKTYFGMACVAIGLWPQWVVKDFRIIEKFDDYNNATKELYSKVGDEVFQRQNREDAKTADLFTTIDNDERLAFANFVAAITTSRIVLFQIIPYFTVFSVISTAIANTPLFVMDKEMNDRLPAMFEWKAGVIATKLLINDQGHAPLYQRLFLTWYIFWNRSRAIQFFVNIYVFIVALKIYIDPRSVPRVVPVLLVIVFHQCLLASGYVILLVRKLLFPDINKIAIVLDEDGNIVSPEQVDQPPPNWTSLDYFKHLSNVVYALYNDTTDSLFHSEMEAEENSDEKVDASENGSDLGVEIFVDQAADIEFNQRNFVPPDPNLLVELSSSVNLREVNRRFNMPSKESRNTRTESKDNNGESLVQQHRL